METNNRNVFTIHSDISLNINILGNVFDSFIYMTLNTFLYLKLSLMFPFLIEMKI